MRKTILWLCALSILMLYPAVRVFAEDHSLILLSQSDRTVYDMDPVSGKIINQIQLGGVPTSAVFSWDEQWLFVAVPDQGYISIVDLHTFKETSKLIKPEFKAASSLRRHRRCTGNHAGLSEVVRFGPGRSRGVQPATVSVQPRI